MLGSNGHLRNKAYSVPPEGPGKQPFPARGPEACVQEPESEAPASLPFPGGRHGRELAPEIQPNNNFYSTDYIPVPGLRILCYLIPITRL